MKSDPKPVVPSAAAPSQSPERRNLPQNERHHKFRVALDIGHTPRASGAIGADGAREYDFNKRIVNLLAIDLQKEANLEVLVINKEGHEITLARRSMIANSANADLFLAIHHDSANDRYLEPVTVNGKVYHQTTRFHGYSVFFSRKNPRPEESLKFALALGKAMHQAGFTPTLHHAEPIQGENRELINRDVGVYRFDDLVVLKRASMPAALLECGLIVNPDEERELQQSDRQTRTVQAVKAAILQIAASEPAEQQPPATSTSQR